MNKKGFSLVELLIAITIMSILAAFLVPALTTSSAKAKNNMDEANLSSFTSTLQMALQQNETYKDVSKIIENTKDKKLIIYCRVNEDTNVLEITYCAADDRMANYCKSGESGTVGTTLTKIKKNIKNYINGKIEPVEFKSQQYKDQSYKFIITLPDVDFKVNIEMQVLS